jgi:hypothetical protein
MRELGGARALGRAAHSLPTRLLLRVPRTQVLFGEDSHTFRDTRPAFRNLWACLRSEKG